MQTSNRLYFIFNLLFLLILMGLSASCANKEETIERILVEKELFDQAQNRLRSGNFAAAAMSLEMLEARYPFGRFATQAQSELIYAYFKSANYEAAISAADRFISLHPNHPNIDYAYYLKGMSGYTADMSIFNPNMILKDVASKRDLNQAKKSFSDLSDFLLRFPDSDYADQARQRMVFLRNLIAKKEIYVATFYMERKAFVAALNRANYVIEHLPNSSQVEQALEIKIEAYKELNQSDLANITQDLLDAFKEKKIKS